MRFCKQTEGLDFFCERGVLVLGQVHAIPSAVLRKLPHHWLLVCSAPTEVLFYERQDGTWSFSCCCAHSEQAQVSAVPTAASSTSGYSLLWSLTSGGPWLALFQAFWSNKFMHHQSWQNLDFQQERILIPLYF